MFVDKPKEGEPWDVIIIGSGPSALTAAIYTTRGAASTLVLAGEAWGGQLMLTTEVDNFPGFPEGIMGPDLMENMRKQAERFGAEVVYKHMTTIDISQQPVKIAVGDSSYFAKSVIIATGAKTKWLEVPGEDKLRGKGVSSCAPCDAPFFKNKEVIVVGGGDSAMEEALVLTKYATSVTIVHRKSEFRASAAMQKKVFDNEKITVVWNTQITEMVGENKLEAVKLKTIEADGSERDWEKKIDGVFVAIGHIPATDPFRGIITTDEKGYIVPEPTEEFKSATNVEGIFVAGDVHDHTYRQAITAAGFGCMAGMDALKYLDKETPNW